VVGGLADHVNSPTFATSVGLVLYAHRNRPQPLPRTYGYGLKRLVGIFKEFF
jgi:hypothetical protein